MAAEPSRATADELFDQIAQHRELTVSWNTLHDSSGSLCDAGLSARVAEAIAAEGIAVRRLPSGAGHDAMAMAALTPTAMLFVRCEGGVSHDPAESMTAEDAAAAAAVTIRLMRGLD